MLASLCRLVYRLCPERFFLCPERFFVMAMLDTRVLWEIIGDVGEVRHG